MDHDNFLVKVESPCVEHPGYSHDVFMKTSDQHIEY